MMEVLVTTGAIRRAKLQSKCHHQQTNILLLQTRCPTCRPNNSVSEEKAIDTCPTECKRLEMISTNYDKVANNCTVMSAKKCKC